MTHAFAQSEEQAQAYRQGYQAGIDDAAEKGWEYIVKATREENWSKEDYIKALQDNK